jgi:hypothetical protein
MRAVERPWAYGTTTSQLKTGFLWAAGLRAFFVAIALLLFGDRFPRCGVQHQEVTEIPIPLTFCLLVE